MDAAYREKWEKKVALHNVYRKKKPFAGLRFFSACHTQYKWRWVVVSRHYPWQLCWCWFLDICLTKPNDLHWRFSFHRWPMRGDGRLRQVIFYFGFGHIGFHRQYDQGMLLDQYFREENIQ